METYQELIFLRDELEQIKSEIKRNAIYGLQISLEMNFFNDIPKYDIKCPICNSLISKNTQKIIVSNNFWHTGKISRVECQDCGLVFGPLGLIQRDPDRLSEDYKILYSYYAEGNTQIYQKMVFERLSPSKQKNYLNYGCGNWTKGIEELLGLGWLVYGYEPNLSLQHHNIKLTLNELNTLSFDGLFSHNFIEHIQNPIQQFIEWNRLLKVGSRMAHSSPCFKWKFDFSNFHLFFFLGNSLEILARKTGFEIIEIYDYNPEVDAEFTRIVVFEKIKDIVSDISNGICLLKPLEVLFLSNPNALNNPQESNMKFYGQFTPPVDQFIFERYFSDIGIEGVFVECGAFDGLTECSCKFFEETMGWKGYNFEPLPWVFKNLQNNRPLATNLNYALSNYSGKAVFHAVNHPQFGLNCTNGSLHHQDSHKSLLNEIGCSFEDIEVELISWPKFIQDFNVTRVDLLVLDVEVHELSVLEGMKNCDVLPDVLCIEYGHLGLDLVRMHLESLGYSYDITSNANAYFIKNEKISLFAFRRQKLITTEHLPQNVDHDNSELVNMLREENTILKATLNDLTKIYNDILNSKGFKFIQVIKQLVGKK